MTISYTHKQGGYDAFTGGLSSAAGADKRPSFDASYGAGFQQPAGGLSGYGGQQVAILVQQTILF